MARPRGPRGGGAGQGRYRLSLIGILRVRELLTSTGFASLRNRIVKGPVLQDRGDETLALGREREWVWGPSVETFEDQGTSKL